MIYTPTYSSEAHSFNVRRSSVDLSLAKYRICARGGLYAVYTRDLPADFRPGWVTPVRSRRSARSVRSERDRFSRASRSPSRFAAAATQSGFRSQDERRIELFVISVGNETLQRD